MPKASGNSGTPKAKRPQKERRNECPACRRRFVKTAVHQRYCSEVCRKQGFKESRKNSCPVCGKGFVKLRPHQIYCSTKCRWDAWLQKKIEIEIGKRTA